MKVKTGTINAHLKSAFSQHLNKQKTQNTMPKWIVSKFSLDDHLKQTNKRTHEQTNKPGCESVEKNRLSQLHRVW